MPTYLPSPIRSKPGDERARTKGVRPGGISTGLIRKVPYHVAPSSMDRQLPPKLTVARGSIIPANKVSRKPKPKKAVQSHSGFAEYEKARAFKRRGRGERDL